MSAMTATLAPELHIACEGEMWRATVARLEAASPNEACCFMLTRPSRGQSRTTVLLGEPIWPHDGEVTATPESLDIKGDYISRALDASIDAGPLVGLALIHTHPEHGSARGVGRFSPRDDWYEKRLFPTLTLDRSQALFASIVLGKGASVDARAWWKTRALQTEPVSAIRLVSKTLRILETPHSAWTDHPDPEVVDRSTRMWGKEGRRRLQNLRIGVVGAGGTGSLVIAIAAMMGVGKLRVWDDDVVQKSNLNRLLGATREDVGKPKVEVLAVYARRIATADPFDFEPIRSVATGAACLDQLKDCDVLFSCVDKLAPRVPINDLAYAHLVPTIDMGSWVHEDKEKGLVDDFMTHAGLLAPGMPCARCTQKLSPRALTREAQGAQAGAEMRAGYGLSLTGGPEEPDPSVLPLNLAGVGLAMLQFMQLVLHVTPKTPRNLSLRMPLWDLDESDLEAQADCGCVADIGLGDTCQIRPVEGRGRTS